MAISPATIFPATISPATARRRALVAAIVVTILWSSSWVLIRIGMDDEALPPLTFAGLRYGSAATVLWAWVLLSADTRRELSTITRRDGGGMLLLGVGFYAITQGAQFVAIDNQPAATTSLVLSLTPLAVAFIGAWTIDEPPTLRQLVGGITVAAGAWIYFAGDLGATAVGMAAAVVGVVANTLSSVAGRSVNRRANHPPVVVTAVSMGIGALLLLVAGTAVDGVPSLTVRAAVIVGWLAVVNTALAFTLWNASLRHLSAVESSGINNLMLIQIALLAWVFLDEAPGVAGLVGIVVVSAGVYFTQRR